jgi:hypothetical protein
MANPVVPTPRPQPVQTPPTTKPFDIGQAIKDFTADYDKEKIVIPTEMRTSQALLRMAAVNNAVMSLQKSRGIDRAAATQLLVQTAHDINKGGGKGETAGPVRKAAGLTQRILASGLNEARGQATSSRFRQLAGSGLPKAIRPPRPPNPGDIYRSLKRLF